MTNPENSLDTQVLVIGAGPGGYVAAIRAAQLGLEVTVVEPVRLGGVCLNCGCIPSKALIHASARAYEAGRGAHLGVTVAGVEVDLPAMQTWKTGVVNTLVAGIEDLFKRHKIRLVQGSAHFTGPHRVEVTGSGAPRSINFEKAIIAPGSLPMELPGLPFDGDRVISSTEALALTEIPRALAVVGGGYIGLELGTVYARLGSQVTVVEMQDQILPGLDKALVLPVKKRLGEMGVAVHTRVRAQGLEEVNGRMVLTTRSQGNEEDMQIPADKVLVAVGRRPHTSHLALDQAGLEADAQGFINVNSRLETSQSHLLAIGDAVGQPLLAHKASREGKVAAEVLAGLSSSFEHRAIPAVVFTDPEVAVVGLSEGEAREQGRQVVTGKFPFQALSRALTADAPAGFVKVVADRESGVILGMQMVGAEASNCIAEATLAVRSGATLEDLAHTIHAHPTFPEATEEAVEAALGHAVHLFVIPRPQG